jgi:hypothetical protein
MESLWHWGSGIIVFIQAVHNPVLDGFFNAVTFTGEAEFFLLIFPRHFMFPSAWPAT